MLRDRLSYGKEQMSHNAHDAGSSYQYTPKNNGHSKTSDYCKGFNRGKCNLGSKCMSEHRCSYCNKFGHGVIVCRKLIFEREKSGKKDNGRATTNSTPAKPNTN